MGLKLVDLRKEKGITQLEVAELVGIQRAYYTMLEKGRRRPSVDVAKRIGLALDFDWTRFYESEQENINSKIKKSTI